METQNEVMDTFQEITIKEEEITFEKQDDGTSYAANFTAAHMALILKYAKGGGRTKNFTTGRKGNKVPKPVKLISNSVDMINNERSYHSKMHAVFLSTTEQATTTKSDLDGDPLLDDSHKFEREVTNIESIVEEIDVDIENIHSNKVSTLKMKHRPVLRNMWPAFGTKMDDSIKGSEFDHDDMMIIENVEKEIAMDFAEDYCYDPLALESCTQQCSVNLKNISENQVILSSTQENHTFQELNNSSCNVSMQECFVKLKKLSETDIKNVSGNGANNKKLYTEQCAVNLKNSSENQIILLSSHENHTFQELNLSSCNVPMQECSVKVIKLSETDIRNINLQHANNKIVLPKSEDSSIVSGSIKKLQKAVNFTVNNTGSEDEDLVENDDSFSDSSDSADEGVTSFVADEFDWASNSEDSDSENLTKFPIGAFFEKLKSFDGEEWNSDKEELSSGEEEEQSEANVFENENDEDRSDTNSCLWQSVESFQPNTYPFQESVGLQHDCNLNEQSSQINFFEYFFDQPLMKYIMEQTNKFYKDERERLKASQFSRMQRWQDTNIEELYVFIALTCLMPHIHKHKLQDYWSTESLIETPSFRKYMSRDRYFLLMRFLHFSSNKIPPHNSHDHLSKIRYCISHMKSKFSNIYNPGQKLVVDESLALFKGWAKFQHYLPHKHYKSGMKCFLLCDRKSGLLLNFIFHTRTNIDCPTDHSLGLSGSIVKKLMDKYLNKGHILYTASCFTTPELSKYLHENNTGSCGNVKVNRENFPKFPPSSKGDCLLMKSSPILAIKWTNKGDIHMLTTIHSGRMMDSEKINLRTNKVNYKPDAVIDYNINMCLIDKTDIQTSCVGTHRKTTELHKKVFFHLLDMSLYNSFVLYLEITKKKVSMREFFLSLVSQILKKYGTISTPRPGRQSLRDKAPDRLLSSSYIERHHLERLSPVGNRAVGQRKCCVCAHTMKRPKRVKAVSNWCRECKVAFCLQCFVDFHSRENF